MKKQRRNQKGLSLILAVIIVVVVVIVVAVFLSTQKGGLPTGTQQTSQNIPAIQDAGGLNSAASELDNTDLNAVDKELNQLDSDASTF